MRLKRIASVICICLGAALLAGAGLMIFHNDSEDRSAEKSSLEIVSALEERYTSSDLSSAPDTEAPAASPAPTLEPVAPTEVINGREYVGYLIFPSLDRKLPVMRIKYTDDLDIAPCLEKGHPWTDDAVISGHNYSSHFGPLMDWKGGETVVFQSFDGREIRYKVMATRTVEATDIRTVTESDHDLVLYTCDLSGAKRIMLGCDRE